MNIAIVGYGTIGSGVYEILSSSYRKHNDIKVTAIVIKEGVPVLPEMTTSFQEILANKDIHCVVETMGGVDLAYTYIKSALMHQKHVVTANKAVVSAHLMEFLALAKEYGVKFLFEASVGGGMPWIKQLLEVARIDEITSFSGILNGTTNYILDQMTKYDLSFDLALAEAMSLGYAEADPSADIDGVDVQRKLMISACLAFGGLVKIEDIAVEGIRWITKEDIAYYKQLGLVVKLVATGNKIAGGYACRVEPMLVRPTSVLGQIDDNLNTGIIVGHTIGQLQVIGQGAGKLPTAHALVQDLIDIQQVRSLDIPMPNKQLALVDEAGYYLIRVTKPNRESDGLLASITKKRTIEQDMGYHHTGLMQRSVVDVLVQQLRAFGYGISFARYEDGLQEAKEVQPT